MKRRRTYAFRGEHLTEDMFDYNVLVVLARLDRSSWHTVFEVAHEVAEHPNVHTYANVAASLARSAAKGDIKRSDAFPDAPAFRWAPPRPGLV